MAAYYKRNPEVKKMHDAKLEARKKKEKKSDESTKE